MRLVEGPRGPTRRRRRQRERVRRDRQPVVRLVAGIDLAADPAGRRRSRRHAGADVGGVARGQRAGDRGSCSRTPRAGGRGSRRAWTSDTRTRPSNSQSTPVRTSDPVAACRRCSHRSTVRAFGGGRATARPRAVGKSARDGGALLVDAAEASLGRRDGFGHDAVGATSSARTSYFSGRNLIRWPPTIPGRPHVGRLAQVEHQRAGAGLTRRSVATYGEHRRRRRRSAVAAGTGRGRDDGGHVEAARPGPSAAAARMRDGGGADEQLAEHHRRLGRSVGEKTSAVVGRRAATAPRSAPQSRAAPDPVGDRIRRQSAPLRRFKRSRPPTPPPQCRRYQRRADCPSTTQYGRVRTARRRPTMRTSERNTPAPNSASAWGSTNSACTPTDHRVSRRPGRRRRAGCGPNGRRAQASVPSTPSTWSQARATRRCGSSSTPGSSRLSRSGPRSGDARAPKNSLNGDARRSTSTHVRRRRARPLKFRVLNPSSAATSVSWSGSARRAARRNEAPHRGGAQRI